MTMTVPDRDTVPAAPTAAPSVLWYWPFARPEEMQLVEAFGADHRLHVETIDRDAAPEAGRYGEAVVERGLPDIDRAAHGIRWPWSRLATYRQRARRRRELMQALAPDLVHYHFLNRFTDRFGRPSCTWVASVHDVHPHQPRLGRFERWILADLYRRPDGLIVHHQWLADQLVDDFGIDPERIAVVPIQVFPVDGAIDRLPSERPMVLCFGALRPNKGILSMIELMAHPLLADVDLHIAGRGDAAFEAEVLAAGRGRANVTVETGYVTPGRKDELFRAAAVVVLPYESFTSQSAVLHDAYGHRRPVVVTDVGALGPTVRHDRTGIVVDVGDRTALVDAVIAMAGPAGDDAAAAASEIAEARTPARIASMLHDAYERFGR